MAVLVRFLRDGRPFITLLPAVMLLASVGSCADPKIDRCLKLREEFRNLGCPLQPHLRGCESLRDRIAEECGPITTP